MFILLMDFVFFFFFFFQAEDGIRDFHVTGVQTCALPIFHRYIGWRFGESVRREAVGHAASGNVCIAAGEYVDGRITYDHRVLRGGAGRSEERRVGKECRSRWSAEHYKINNEKMTAEE